MLSFHRAIFFLITFPSPHLNTNIPTDSNVCRTTPNRRLTIRVDLEISCYSRGGDLKVIKNRVTLVLNRP